MRLALFDLDHTLIPFDSGMAWTRFLVERGALPREAEDAYLAYCHQYVAGTLDIHAMHRATMAPMAGFEPTQLAAWSREFEAVISSRLPADMRALVQRHQAAGDLCAIVTATTRLVATPFARAFGIDALVCTEAEMSNGRPTGAIRGEPCYHEHKLDHVERWLVVAAVACVPLSAPGSTPTRQRPAAAGSRHRSGRGAAGCKAQDSRRSERLARRRGSGARVLQSQ